MTKWSVKPNARGTFRDEFGTHHWISKYSGRYVTKRQDETPEPDLRPRCGAKCRTGLPCKRLPLPNGRCRNHGGMSTGPKTPEGKARRLAGYKAWLDKGGKPGRKTNKPGKKDDKKY